MAPTPCPSTGYAEENRDKTAPLLCILRKSILFHDFSKSSYTAP